MTGVPFWFLDSLLFLANFEMALLAVESKVENGGHVFELVWKKATQSNF